MRYVGFGSYGRVGGVNVNVLAFDLETVPDTAAGRRIYGLDDLSDSDVATAMTRIQEQKSGREFLRHHLHRIVSISVATRFANGQFLVRSIGEAESTEADLISRFYAGISKYTPVLVSWNGGGFDLPVLHYRSLLHGVSAPRYWEIGEDEPSFRWNNYLSRFHWRHVDLMDVLSGFQMRAVAPLDEVAVMLGLPGKMGMHGSRVWEAYLHGDIQGIRNYCEADALNTYLLYLRFELIRGRLSREAFRLECAQLRSLLAASEHAHLREFAGSWSEAFDSAEMPG